MIRRTAISTPLMVVALMSFSQHKVQFIVSSLPSNRSPDSLYIAGSFNNWNTQDKNYFFQKNEKGSYSVGMKLEDGMYEFKITRGAWDKVECKKGGADIQNRSLQLSSDTTIHLMV